MCFWKLKLSKELYLPNFQIFPLKAHIAAFSSIFSSALRDVASVMLTPTSGSPSQGHLARGPSDVIPENVTTPEAEVYCENVIIYLVLILAFHWPPVITWPGYWPLIRWECNHISGPQHQLCPNPPEQVSIRHQSLESGVHASLKPWSISNKIIAGVKLELKNQKSWESDY